MSDRTLLASVVLFRELYNSDKDVYDVIAQFIKAALLFSQRWSINTTEAAHLLKRDFDLSLPEAVVGTTLHKRLYMRDGVVSYANGTYSTSKALLAASEPLISSLQRVRTNQQAVLDRLTTYVESTEGPLKDDQRELLASCFCDYLFDQDVNTRFSESISAFIIRSQTDSSLTEQLNEVREGFVLYDGVRHSPDLSSISLWRSRLVIFLDTEHLFNAVGLNGVLYKELLSDLISLASDVRGKDGGMISLRYFSESADEVDRFYRVAEHIIEGKATLDPSKPAMVSILNGCTTKGDILTKKARFYADLKSRGIHPAEPKHEAAEIEFNVESADLLEEVRGNVEKQGREFYEDKCVGTLRMFTKINTLRRGVSSRAFEDIGAILISGSNIANVLAFHPKVRGDSSHIPFSTDLEFATNRLWFKLHKNLAKGISPPRSLSALAKAQVVISSQLNGSVSAKFDQITRDFASGELSKQQMKLLFNDLRSHAATPEALNATNIESALTFLDHKDYEYHLRERSALEGEAEAGRVAMEQLAAIRTKADRRRRSIVSKISIGCHLLIVGAMVTLALGALIGLYRVLESLGPGGNEPLSILSILATVVIGLAPLLGYRHIYSWLLRSHETLSERIYKMRG